MHDPQDIQMAPGLFTNRTARNVRGRWREGQNVRFYDQLPQKMGGCTEIQLTDDDGILKLYVGHARSCKQWNSLDGQNWIAFGTECKLYLINNGRLFDITPLRSSRTITASLSITNGSRLVTVVVTDHGAQEGDHAVFKDFSAIGNQTINGEREIFSVIDADTFTVQMPTNSTSTVANAGGTGTIDFEISCGLEADSILSGYGTGTYGTGTYGTARTDSTFIGLMRYWSLDTFGEDLLASPSGEGLYVWERQNGANSRAQLVPNSPPNIEFMLVGPDERHVLALGTNLLDPTETTVTGQQDKMFLRWCEGDNFESWVQTEENDAGSERLDNGSRLITAVKTRGHILLFTDEALYGVALVGGNDVYDIDPLGSAVKVISKGAVIDVAGVVYFMAKNNFYAFDGTLQIVPCDINALVFDILNVDMGSKVTCRYDEMFDEIHWFFPSTDSDENDSVAVFHRTEKHWTCFKIRRECALDQNLFYGVPIGFGDQTIFSEETGTDYLDEPLVASLRSGQAEIDGGAWYMLVNELIPDFQELTGQIDVQLFGQEEPQNTATYIEGDLFTITSSRDFIQPEFRNRRVGLFIESNDMGDDWRMDTWQWVGGPDGRA